MAINKKKLKDIFGDDSDSKDDDFFNQEPDEEISTDFEFEEDEDALPPAQIIRDPEALPLSQQNIESDIDYALRVQNNLINQSQQLIQIALQNAADGGNARDIEVASETINTATTAIEKLLGLHEKIQKMKVSSQDSMPSSGNTFVQNQVIYNGTTSDILEKLNDGAIDVDKL